MDLEYATLVAQYHHEHLHHLALWTRRTASFCGSRETTQYPAGGPPKLISGRSYERIFFCRLFSTGSLVLRLTKVVFSLPSAMETCTACGGLCICLHRSLCRNADQGEWLVLIGPGRDLCHLLRMRSATRSDRHLISGLPPINCAAN